MQPQSWQGQGKSGQAGRLPVAGRQWPGLQGRQRRAQAGASRMGRPHSAALGSEGQSPPASQHFHMRSMQACIFFCRLSDFCNFLLPQGHSHFLPSSGFNAKNNPSGFAETVEEAPAVFSVKLHPTWGYSMASGPGQLPALTPWPCPRVRAAEVFPSAAARGENTDRGQMRWGNAGSSFHSAWEGKELSSVTAGKCRRKQLFSPALLRGGPRPGPAACLPQGLPLPCLPSSPPECSSGGTVPQETAAQGSLAPGPGGTTNSVNTTHTAPLGTHPQLAGPGTALPYPQQPLLPWPCSTCAPSHPAVLPCLVISAICTLFLSGKEVPAQTRPLAPAKSEDIGVPLGKISKMKAAAVFILNVLFPLPPILKKEMGIVILCSLRLPASRASFSFLAYEPADVSQRKAQTRSLT